jgi:alpha-tubulin suppressor-like RCC1 family protein
VRKPSRVAAGVPYRVVAAAQHHTCAIRRDNALECWGLNAEGELGTGAADDLVVQTPMQVSGDQGYRAVSSNWFHTCALRADDSLWCWGRNTEGQLGLGDDLPRNVPTRVDPAHSYRVVTSAHFHTCAFASDGLFCWGENSEYGQLGLGEVGRKNTPTQVPIP